MTIKERVYASKVLEQAERIADYAENIGISCSLISRKQYINQSGLNSSDETAVKSLNEYDNL